MPGHFQLRSKVAPDLFLRDWIKRTVGVDMVVYTNGVNGVLINGETEAGYVVCGVTDRGQLGYLTPGPDGYYVLNVYGSMDDFGVQFSETRHLDVELAKRHVVCGEFSPTLMIRKTYKMLTRDDVDDWRKTNEALKGIATLKTLKCPSGQGRKIIYNTETNDQIGLMEFDITGDIHLALYADNAEFALQLLSIV